MLDLLIFFVAILGVINSVPGTELRKDNCHVLSLSKMNLWSLNVN